MNRKKQARRSAACIKACAAISTHSLENEAIYDLIAALQRLTDWAEDDPLGNKTVRRRAEGNQAVLRARSALYKAESKGIDPLECDVRGHQTVGVVS